jgi:cation diffusion facilitator CzcD-associated flavoprotein CzcO
MVDVAIVGSGFGGLGAAIRLRQRGVRDIAIFERASSLGGTWRDNIYPGCRCDVASDLYSFSFAPNPTWTNTYSYQPEIRQYLEDVADGYDVRDLIQFNHDVADMTFDAELSQWRLTTNHGEFRARCVIVATGSLAELKLPDLSGLIDFNGPIMHTARWDENVDLANKRVGVIGTGASAVQVIPEIAPIVESLCVFQRTPSWVLPHRGHPVMDRTQRLFANVPLAQRAVRTYRYWRNELTALGFVRDPRRMSLAEGFSRDLLERQVADPQVREQLSPRYRLGCKRVLISNAYYPAFERDNVELVTTPIQCVEGSGVRTADGVLHSLDVLISATGFYVTDNPMAQKVHGMHGGSLADAFHGGLPHYKGTSFPGFPNLYMLGGPNTGLGHSSVLFMMESQLNYATRAIANALGNNVLVEPKTHVARRWTRDIQAKFPSTVWGSGCSSWYQNAQGRNTVIWPNFTFTFRRATRRFAKRDHLVSSVSSTSRD